MTSTSFGNPYLNIDDKKRTWRQNTMDTTSIPHCITVAEVVFGSEPSVGAQALVTMSRSAAG